MIEDSIIARLADGRTVRVPLAWSWRPAEATPDMGNGQRVRWPDVDEDISAMGMLSGTPARRPKHVAKPRQLMKKESAKPSKVKYGEMRPEYDFSKAVRGKHYKPLHEGYTVYVHKADGTTVVQHYKLEEGAVMLEPDVRQYFPDSEAVNAALRSLIALMSEMRVPPGKRRTAQRRARSVKA